jgi:hypothetical protein
VTTDGGVTYEGNNTVDSAAAFLITDTGTINIEYD